MSEPAIRYGWHWQRPHGGCPYGDARKPARVGVKRRFQYPYNGAVRLARAGETPTVCGPGMHGCKTMGHARLLGRSIDRLTLCEFEGPFAETSDKFAANARTVLLLFPREFDWNTPTRSIRQYAREHLDPALYRRIVREGVFK